MRRAPTRSIMRPTIGSATADEIVRPVSARLRSARPHPNSRWNASMKRPNDANTKGPAQVDMPNIDTATTSQPLKIPCLPWDTVVPSPEERILRQQATRVAVFLRHFVQRRVVEQEQLAAVDHQRLVDVHRRRIEDHV